VGRIWAFILVLGTVAQAQDAARRAERIEQELNEVLEARYERVAGLSALETSRIDYGVYTTASGILSDRIDGTSSEMTQIDARFWLDARSRGHRLYGRLRLHYQWFGEGDSWWASGDGFRYPIGDRYWYSFDWRVHQKSTKGVDPDWNWNTRVGRQLVSWGTGFVLRRALYAWRLRGEWDEAHVEAMVGNTPDNDFIDFDGSRPNYDSNTDRLFYGLIADWRGIRDHRPYVLFLAQDDQNDATLPGGGRYRYDSYYAAIGSSGQLGGTILYRLELVYEWGKSLSDLLGAFPQTSDDIEAWALKFEFIWTPRRFPLLRDWRVDFELLIGSGDSDRGHSAHTVNGNLSGTSDESFNAFGSYNTGLALAPDVANLVSLRLSPRWRPFRQTEDGSRFGVGLDLFGFFKLDKDAPLSVATLPGRSYVGLETDLLLEWQVTSDVVVQARYGIFLPGDAFPTSQALQFFYWGVSYGF